MHYREVYNDSYLGTVVICTLFNSHVPPLPHFDVRLFVLLSLSTVAPSPTSPPLHRHHHRSFATLSLSLPPPPATPAPSPAVVSAASTLLVCAANVPTPFARQRWQLPCSPATRCSNNDRLLAPSYESLPPHLLVVYALSSSSHLHCAKQGSSSTLFHFEVMCFYFFFNNILNLIIYI